MVSVNKAAQNKTAALQYICELFKDSSPQKVLSPDECEVVRVDVSDIFSSLYKPVYIVIAEADSVIKLYDKEGLDSVRYLIETALSTHKSRAKIAPIIICGPGSIARALHLVEEAYDGTSSRPAFALSRFGGKNANDTLASALLSYNDSIVSLLSPYQSDKSVVGSMFVGRLENLQTLKDSSVNWIITGPRRIGKTSLAHQLQSNLGYLRVPHGLHRKDRTIRRCSLVDVSIIGDKPANFIWRRVLEGFGLSFKDYATKGYYAKMGAGKQALGQDNIDEAKALDAIISEYEGELTIVLDEVDGWLKREARSWGSLDQLRSMTDNGRARVVLVGYETLWCAKDSQDFPLWQRCNTMFLRPLEFDDVKELVAMPMGELKIELERPSEIFHRVWNTTSGMPNLVQDVCNELVKLSRRVPGTDRRIVGVNELDPAEHNSQAVQIYKNSVIHSPFPLAKIIAGVSSLYTKSPDGDDEFVTNTSALESSASPSFFIRDILRIVEEHGGRVSDDEVTLALAHLEICHILVHDGRHRWRWANDGARKVLGRLVLSRGFDLWVASLVREHAEGGWRKEYERLGHFQPVDLGISSKSEP